MPTARRNRSDETAMEVAVSEKEKHHADATDEEQISDDEAPEEVSTAAATALAGRRRKAELEARQAAPKRKRARSSKSKPGAAGAAGTAGDDVGEAEGDASGLELSSDLLLEVKSGGLQRMEEEAAMRELEHETALAEAAAAKSASRLTSKAADLPRSDNFQLVVLNGGEFGGDGASSKAHAAESAKEFLRKRTDNHKRVSHALFKARKLLGPSPNF